MMKKIISIVMFLIPLIIVFVSLCNVITTLHTGTEYKLKITQYDPYDIFRGKYINLSISQGTVFIDELIGYEKKDYEYSKIDNAFTNAVIHLHNEENKETKYKNIKNMSALEKIYDKHSDAIFSLLNYSYDYNKAYNIIKDMYAKEYIEECEEYNNNDYNQKDFEKVYGQYADKMINDYMMAFADISSANRKFEDIFYIYENNYERFSNLTDKEKYKIDNRLKNECYIEISKDKDGYAVFGNTYLYKSNIESDKDYLSIKINYGYRSNIFAPFDVSRDSIRFFVDERYSQEYSGCINYASSNGKDVCLNVIVNKGSMVLKNITIDNIPLEEYYKDVYKEKLMYDEYGNTYTFE